MTAVVIVGGACVVGIVALMVTLRRWDRQDAERDAAAVIDSAERIVRVAASRRNHPSQWDGET